MDYFKEFFSFFLIAILLAALGELVNVILHFFIVEPENRFLQFMDRSLTLHPVLGGLIIGLLSYPDLMYPKELIGSSKFGYCCYFMTAGVLSYGIYKKLDDLIKKKMGL